MWIIAQQMAPYVDFIFNHTDILYRNSKKKTIKNNADIQKKNIGIVFIYKYIPCFSHNLCTITNTANINPYQTFNNRLTSFILLHFVKRYYKILLNSNNCNKKVTKSLCIIAIDYEHQYVVKCQRC